MSPRYLVYVDCEEVVNKKLGKVSNSFDIASRGGHANFSEAATRRTYRRGEIRLIILLIVYLFDFGLL